jgi:preprotein translocase subunit SecE
VARINPGKFLNEVKVETAKVVWPTRKETITTAIMVLIMTTILAIIFFGIDSAFNLIVKSLLDLVA